MGKFQVLATSTADPIFLVTPSGPKYINELRAFKLVASGTPQVLTKIKLQDIDVSRKKRGFWEWLRLSAKEGQDDKSLYGAICSLKNRFNCDIEFKVNSNCDIAVAAKLPGGPILSVHLLRKMQQQDMNGGVS